MYGVDIFVKQQLNEIISLWAGYTYSEIKLTMDTAKFISYDLKYSQPHSIYIGGSYIKNNFKLSAGWKYSSGLNARSIDILEVKRAYERQHPNSPNNPFANLPERYPTVHMMDISTSYKLPKTSKRPFSTTIGLSLINVFNTDNITDRLVRGTAEAQAPPNLNERKAMQFAPNLMVLVEF
jgi:outer membrane receptor protein involved in Fe transport